MSDRVSELVGELHEAVLRESLDGEELRSLLVQCADCLSLLRPELERAKRAGADQIEAAAKLVESDEAVWPEDLERLSRLAGAIRTLRSTAP